MCQLRHCSQESTSEQLHGHKQELAKLDKSLAESTAALEGHKKEFAAHKEATGKGLEAHQQALESHKAETTKSFETQQQALAKHKEEATSQLEAHKKEFAAHKEATGKGLEAHQQALESHKAETTKSFETQQQALAKHKEEATSQLEAHKKEFAAHKEATGKGLEAHQQALESHKAETTKSFETQQQALEIQKKSTAEQIESHKKEVAVTSKQVSTFEKLIASQEEKSLQSLQAAVKELKDELQKMEKSRAAERAEIDQIKKQLELQRSAAAKPGAPAPPAPPVPPKAPPKWWKWWPWWLLAWRNSWTLERLSPKKSGFLGARFGGTSLTIENSDKAIKVIVEQKLRNASVELQLELQRYTSGKKRCCKRFFFVLIGNGSQKDFSGRHTKRYHSVWFFWDVYFWMNGSESFQYLETWEPIWNGKAHAKSCSRKILSKADHLERKNPEGTNWQRAKEQRLVHSFADLFVKFFQFFWHWAPFSATNFVDFWFVDSFVFHECTLSFWMAPAAASWRAFAFEKEPAFDVCFARCPWYLRCRSSRSRRLSPHRVQPLLLQLTGRCQRPRRLISLEPPGQGIHGAFLWHAWCMMLIRLKTI